METVTSLVVSGHRPPRLGGYFPRAVEVVNKFAVQSLAARRNDTSAPTFDYVAIGMAQGWDMACARACMILDIPFVAYLAFEGVERRWPAQWQRIFQYLCGHATNVVIVGNGRDPNRDLMARNTRLLEYAVDVLALCYDESQRSGTADTMRKARDKGIPVTNLWSRWDLFSKSQGA